jgi:outer membrane protein assembly factor BamB
LLQALDSETGRRLWVAQVGGPERELFAVAANSTSLFVVTATDVYALDKQTGTRLWQAQLQDTPSSSPTATETELFVPTFRGQLDVYNIDEQRISWYYSTGAKILSPPLVVLGNVAFANADGSLYVAHRDRRELIFRYHTDAPVSAPLGKIDNEWILLASEDYNVYCLHAANGRTRWRFAAEGPIQAAPTPIAGKIYVLPSGTGMFQIDAETGYEDWRSPHPVRFMAASPTRLYSRDRLENLVIVDRETGELRGAVEASRFALSVRNVENDRLFLASREGLIVCLREAQLDRPVPVEPETPEEAPPAADAPATSPPAQSP